MKCSNNTLFRVSIISFILSLALLFILFVLTTEGINIQIGIPPNGISHRILSFLLIIIAVISLVCMVKDNVIRVVIIGIGVFFILVIYLPIFFLEYTHFSSTDNQEHFVVIEGGVGKLYKISDSGIYMNHITDFETDDGYKPFADGAYELEWNSPNELIIYYAFGYTSKDELDKYREITIQLK